MSFELRCFGNSGTGLVAVCDVCGETLEKAADANLCWLPNEFGDGVTYAFKITCKEQCTRRLDHVEGRQWTQDLDLAIGFLMNNTRVDFKRMRAKMQMLHDFGLLGEPRPMQAEEA